MNVIVNGNPREVAPQSTVAQLLVAMELAARPVAVELNLEIVPRAQHERRTLAEGDRLEIVALAGGG